MRSSAALAAGAAATGSVSVPAALPRAGSVAARCAAARAVCLCGSCTTTLWRRARSLHAQCAALDGLLPSIAYEALARKSGDQSAHGSWSLGPRLRTMPRSGYGAGAVDMGYFLAAHLVLTLVPLA